MRSLYKVLTPTLKTPTWAVRAKGAGVNIFNPVLNSDILETGGDFRDKLDSLRINEEVEIEKPVILPPIPDRDNIKHMSEGTPCLYAAGLNYKLHAKEANLTPAKNPTIIIQSPTCVTGHETPIRIPKVCPKPEVDYEAELAIIIGRTCRDAKSAEDALQHIAGYTVSNDVSARRWQGKKGGGQWGRSKSFDTFTPLGPCLVPYGLIPQPNNLDIELTVTRKDEQHLMQKSNTKDMIHHVGELVAYISQDTTLKPWTVILTGTPEGVGYVRDPPFFLQPGDSIAVTIEDIGTLCNSVIGSDSE